ncbi:MAG: hypothetical protein R6X34_15515 [Chloroflexota bacterium]
MLRKAAVPSPRSTSTTIENTPIIDIKGYFPVCDRVNDAAIPAWPDWGIDHLPDEGMGLYEEYEEAQAA